MPDVALGERLQILFKFHQFYIFCSLDRVSAMPFLSVLRNWSMLTRCLNQISAGISELFLIYFAGVSQRSSDSSFFSTAHVGSDDSHDSPSYLYADYV